ncbi:MAG: diaminopimelate epimerase [Clostridia bacterium]|nr:diaminopimelate epimerase [Clostridia bacterium]
MRFTKMHGLGNDFLLAEGPVPENAARLCAALCDRRFGVGADGVIFVSPSQTADCSMNIFNADGSEAGMCGNGIRCVGKFLYDRGMTRKDRLTVETRSGVKALRLRIENGRAVGAAVDMGRVRSTGAPVILPDGMGTGIPVSVGNPHLVIFSDDAETLPLSVLGPAIERDPRFPGGINAEFVRVLSGTKLRMRVWERGCGVTPACGTGACASVFAAVKEGLCPAERPVEVVLDGGSLFITVRADDSVTMEGPAATVFEGEVDI